MDNLEEIIKTLNQEERKEVLEFIEDSRGYDKLFPKVLEFKKELEKDLAELPARYKKLDELKKKLEDKLKTHINWQPFDPDNPPTDTDAEYLVEIKNGDFIHCYMVEYRFYSLCKSIPYYKGEIKAYAIINPSNL